MSERVEGDRAIAFVYRSPRGLDDVIVLRTDATPRDLAAALGTYRRLRRSAVAQRVAIRAISGQPQQTAREFAEAEYLLFRIRSASEREVIGLGLVRSEHVLFANGTLHRVQQVVLATMRHRKVGSQDNGT